MNWKSLALTLAFAVPFTTQPLARAEPNTHAASDEVTYLDGLDRFGVNYSDVGVRYMVDLGHGICDNLHEGYSAVEIAKSMIRANWTSHDAWLTMMLATNFLCPDTVASFKSQQEAAIAAGVGTTAQR